MPTTQIQQMIPKIHDYFLNQPVQYAYIFGSYSRGEETNNSDVDILVKLDSNERIGLLKYVNMICELEKLLGRPVDLVEEDGLDKYVKPFVEKDKILVYERTN